MILSQCSLVERTEFKRLDFLLPQTHWATWDKPLLLYWSHFPHLSSGIGISALPLTVMKIGEMLDEKALQSRGDGALIIAGEKYGDSGRHHIFSHQSLPASGGVNSCSPVFDA